MQEVNTDNNHEGKVLDIRSCITVVVIQMNYGLEYAACQEFVQLIASVLYICIEIKE